MKKFSSRIAVSVVLVAASAITFALVGASGCAADGNAGKVSTRPPPTHIRGGRFALVSLGGEPPESQRPLELNFGADGSVSGFAGVNQFAGTYELAPAG